MVEWIECKISDIGTVVGGATPSTKKAENYEGGNIAWITPKDLSTLSGRYIKCGERNITEIGLKSCSTQLLPENTVLFSSRAPIGYVAIAANEVCTNQGFKSVIPNGATDPLFLFYLLKHNKDKIEAMGSGTTFKEVSGNTMKNIMVRVPSDKEVQKNIASMLGTLDDKIEGNERINNNLEQEAVLLFKKWFIEFDNTSRNMLETRFGLIPELPLVVTDYVANGSFASLKANVTLYQEPNYAYFIRNTDLKSGTFEVFVDKHSYNFLSKSTLYGREIIISNVGDVGSVFLCPKLDKPMTLGNNIIMLRPEQENLRYYLYIWFKWLYGQSLIQGIKGGSAQPKFNKTDFKNLPIFLPPDDLLEQFHQIVKPMFELIDENKAENQALTITRDALLPKLMSSELDVSDIDF